MPRKQQGMRRCALAWLRWVAAAGAQVLASLVTLELEKRGADRSEVSLPYCPIHRVPQRSLEEATNGKAKIFVTSRITGRFHQALVPLLLASREAPATWWPMRGTHTDPSVEWTGKMSALWDTRGFLANTHSEAPGDD